MQTIIQNLTKEIDGIDNHELKIKIVTEIMNMCQKIITQEKKDEITKYYKSTLSLFKFNENKILKKITDSLSVVDYSYEKLDYDINVITNITFGSTFKILMSNRIKRHTDCSEFILCSNDDTIKQEFDKLTKIGISIFYKKIGLKNITLELFEDYVATVCDIFDGHYD